METKKTKSFERKESTHVVEVFVRKAGFWNSRNIELTQQFGHTMIRVDDTFYSFIRNDFLPEGTDHCVQIIDSEDFKKTYPNQIWQVVTLHLDTDAKNNLLEYFSIDAKKKEYSVLTNNCTQNCQAALLASGIEFPRKHLFPGQTLRSLIKRRDGLTITAKRTVTVKTDTELF